MADLTQEEYEALFAQADDLAKKFLEVASIVHPVMPPDRFDVLLTIAGGTIVARGLAPTIAHGNRGYVAALLATKRMIDRLARQIYAESTLAGRA